MKTYYATFGIGHAYSGCYVEIVAENHHVARHFMIKNHGNQWSQEVYAHPEYDQCIARHKLRRMATVTQSETTTCRDGSPMFIADRC